MNSEVIDLTEGQALVRSKPVEDTKAKNWIGTLHYSDDGSRGYTLEELEEEIVDIKAKCVYWIIGKEVCPQTGGKHLQCYFQFRSDMRYSTLRRHLKVFWKPANGSPEENRAYCSKDGDFTEGGEMRGTEDKKAAGRKRGGEAIVDKWKDVLDAIKRGDFDNIDPQIYICHFNAIMNIAKRYIMIPPTLTWSDGNPPNLWLHGVAGCGKSRKAAEDYPNAYRKLCNKWWDGFDSEIHKEVIIDDFDRQHNVLCHHLKIWGDRYGFIGEVKGGAFGLRPEVIVVTSNWAPNEIWTDENDLRPILRRFKVINMSPLAMLPAQFVVPQTPVPTQPTQVLGEESDGEEETEQERVFRI